MSGSSLILDPLRGTTSLARVFWVYGLLGSLVYSAFGLLVDPGNATLLWFYEIVGVLYTVYVTVATYRCARNCASPLFAWLARISAVLSLIALPVIAYFYYTGALALPI
jgi:hypothetical protein